MKERHGSKYTIGSLQFTVGATYVNIAVHRKLNAEFFPCMRKLPEMNNFQGGHNNDGEQ